MQYIGLFSQIRKNNFNSVLLLIAFPVLLLAMCYAILFFTNEHDAKQTNQYFVRIVPFVLIGVGTWFLIAWAGHSAFIRMATGSKSLERKENKRVYNLLENICISQGMKMPKLNIIQDDSLNAFASGINDNSYAISLSTGIINKLSDEELEGVLAHELSHIRNRDVRLLIISIIFVGIFSFVAEMAFRSLRFAGRKSDKNGKGSGAIILIVIAITAVAYLISVLLRFGISRKREYLADAGAAEITKKPYALASALRKISNDPMIEAVESRDVAQLFIDNPTPSVHKSASWDNLFATHPPIEKRISLLEQFV
ncbi:M48 family metallopeptidase [Terrimonas pollutisoli]|uniref:M48 family metallopeptidase n=1 Tax=Terrimonas pollutisoli TaxID=3034147 RepID=UPI0023EBF278|nr:M48 family metallopeptidase [Terrimonas sp. H1YJ31]